MQEDKIKGHENQLRALELRKAGLTYQKIADALGYANPMGAWKAVNSALKKTLQEPSDDLRKMEVERLDAMLFALYPSAMKGMQGAVDRILRIMERRAKLLGLDAPTKTDVTSGGKALNWKEFINGNTNTDSEQPK